MRQPDDRRMIHPTGSCHVRLAAAGRGWQLRLIHHGDALIIFFPLRSLENSYYAWNSGIIINSYRSQFITTARIIFALISHDK
jgi:hypothetical protein